MVDRRRILAGLGALALPIGGLKTHPTSLAHAATGEGMRPIPSTGEMIPAVGLGSWITFNVGRDPVLRDRSAEVIAAFFEEGGGMIDSSPMYGSSQEVIGNGLDLLGHPETLFSADKVWTRSDDGRGQIEATRRHWGVEAFDLMQVHNLVGIGQHLPLLFDMKAEGRLRYVGVTTSHGRRHDDLEAVMRREPLDFMQLTLNAVDREAEARLLPLARDRGIAVIVNRPFRRGALPERLRGAPLPGWAAEIGVTTWAQALLKFILAHPAVTVPIPATTRVDHLRENKAAALGALPDGPLRERIAADVRRAL